jgi:hypothetical protein
MAPVAKMPAMISPRVNIFLLLLLLLRRTALLLLGAPLLLEEEYCSSLSLATD